MFTASIIFCPVLEPLSPVSQLPVQVGAGTIEYMGFTGRILAMGKERPENGTVIDDLSPRHTHDTRGDKDLPLLVPHDLHVKPWH